jgi:hypothetical protein
VPSMLTVPTGITKSPRRWFVHSKFDHQAHQFSMVDAGSMQYTQMSCTFCHAAVTQSKLTSDFLSPNLTWKGADGKTWSCADCHHERDTQRPAATVNCVSCHTFHASSPRVSRH